MPRPARVDKPKARSLSIPSSLSDRVDIMLFSPTEGRVPYAAFSMLVEKLLREWLADLGQGME